MEFIIIFSLSTFTANIGFAQAIKSDANDSTITIRLIPEGSYIDSLLVDYAGVWSQGFEKNRFTPCGNWTPDSLGGVAFIPNRMGLSEGKEVWDFIIKKHPDTLSFVYERPKTATYDLFIKARGWLIGPGTYDHFGSNRYTIKTTQFKKVRWAMPGECEE
jgi:hypothetical protein